MAPLSLYSYLTHVGSAQATSYVNSCGERERERERECRLECSMFDMPGEYRSARGLQHRDIFSPSRLTMPRTCHCGKEKKKEPWNCLVAEVPGRLFTKQSTIQELAIPKASKTEQASLWSYIYNLYFNIWTHTRLCTWQHVCIPAVT